MENVLAVKNLCKKYGTQNALLNVNMTINKGDIYGLIGRNGAGKTTLLKSIVQLIKPTSGTIHLFGGNTPKENLKQLERTGCVIETPVAYEQLTAYENLTYYCKLRGITDKNVVEETLKFVGLNDTGKKKYKNFSLGMKQRLGLGITLLSKPDFLILDEPINGLDPIAIAEFRDVLIKLNKDLNITILISSHILEELYFVANRFGFIKSGELIKEMTKEEFEEQSKEFIKLQVDNVNIASTVLKAIGINDFKVVENNKINIYQFNLSISEIASHLLSNNVEILGIHKEGQNLEMYFKELLENN